MGIFNIAKSSSIKLRKATLDHVGILMELEKSVSGKNTYSPALDIEDWKEEFENGEVYFIEYNNKIVGNLSIKFFGNERLYISGLVVIPEFQGKGIAREALRQILEKYKNIRRIDLVTHPDNFALGLFKSLGFVVESRKDNFYGDGEPRLVLVLKK